MKYCTECGAKLNGGRFCGECGRPVAADRELASPSNESEPVLAEVGANATRDPVAAEGLDHLVGRTTPMVPFTGEAKAASNETDLAGESETTVGTSADPEPTESEESSDGVPALSDEESPAEQADPDEQTASTKVRTKRRWIVASAAAVALLAVGGAGVFLYQANEERQLRQVAAAGALATTQATFDQLAMVTNTADVRQAATEAQEARGLLDVNEGAPLVISQADAALAAVAVLGELNADTLNEWSGWRDDIEDAAATVVTEDGVLAPDAGLSAVDKVVTDGQEAINLWFLQTLAAREANTEASDSLERYAAAANAQILQYNELRNEAADWVERAELTNTYRASDAEQFFRQASSDRRSVRDTLSSLTPPAELAAQHAELLSVLTAGIDGIESMRDGLYDNEICFLDCALSETPGYQQFQVTSGLNTERYGRAVDNWQATVEGRRAELANAGLPPKPEV